MGNICRSPTAQGVFEAVVETVGLQDQINIDSAGTHAYHVGESADRRAQQAARQRGIDLSQQHARKTVRHDCDQFDYILAMDEDNLALLTQMCPIAQQHKIGLFLNYADTRVTQGTTDVPDPYYGGTQGFERVLDLVESAAQGLLRHIQKTDL